MLRSVLMILLIVAVPAGVAVWERWDDIRPYPKRFAVIEEGRLYRGAYPDAQHVRRLHQDKKIRTIVALTGRVNDALERDTLATAEELGIRVQRFPMPGDGRGEFEMLDKAADALNESGNWPVFFHCKAGEQRSNATLAAWRMKHCGYTLEQALAELTARHDLEPDDAGEAQLAEHLRNYARHLGLSQSAAGRTPSSPAGRAEAGRRDGTSSEN